MNITAVITTFNRGEIVPDAIRSVLRQTKSVQELLVVDDGSTDGTEETVAQAFSGATITCRYIKKANGGMASSLNHGIEESTGDWVAFLDDDDLWADNHIERIRAIHASCATLGCIAGLREEGNTVQTPPPDLLAEYDETSDIPDVVIHRKRALSRPFFTPVVGTAVVKRSLALQSAFSAAALARVDLHFFWRLSELTDIGLDLRSHGTGRQFRISLLSTDADASEALKEKIVLKRNHDEIAMLRDLLSTRDPAAASAFVQMLENSLIGRAYLLRKYGRHGDALRHLTTCVGLCPPAKLLKEMILAMLRISPRKEAG